MANSGAQVEGILSYDTWGGERETAVDAAARTGAILIINASYFDYGTGEPVAKGGRYDRLLQHFGMDAPAIGVGLYIDQLGNALSRRNRI